MNFSRRIPISMYFLISIVAILFSGGIFSISHAMVAPRSVVRLEHKEKPLTIAVPIILYHYIRPLSSAHDRLGADLSVSPQSFEEQLRALKRNGFTPITLGELYTAFTQQHPLPRRPIIFTFDDGYEDMYTYAFPILRKEGMMGTLFIITNAVEKNGYLTWAQIKTMRSSGVFDVQSHTLNHPDLSRTSQPAAWMEIRHSKDVLEKKLGTRIDFFCYPYGKYTLSIINLVKRAGYLGALTTHFGVLHSKPQAFVMSRVRLTDGDTGRTLQRKINQFIRDETP